MKTKGNQINMYQITGSVPGQLKADGLWDRHAQQSEEMTGE